LTAAFPQRRLLAAETWTAGWRIGGATAPDPQDRNRGRSGAGSAPVQRWLPKLSAG